MTSDLYPYLLDPLITPAIWGGHALVRQYGKTGDPNAAIGESWECWETDRVRNGSMAGLSVADLRAKLGMQLLGDGDPSRPFPILTKFIDAREALSVQVHPDDAYAQRVEHQPNGKTECWLVLAADPGAELVLGWTHDTTRTEYVTRVENGTLGEILRRVPVKEGDAFYLPSGTLHAIGKGIVVYETQQASDLTYRIFDWNRLGTDGKPRELHVAKAADVLNYHQGRAAQLTTIAYHFDGMDRTALIADKHFIVERIHASAEPATLPTYNRPIICTALARPLHLHCDGGDADLAPYQTALVPAGASYVQVQADHGDAPFMCVTPPVDARTLPVRLLAAGIAEDRIDTFMAQFA